MAKAARGGKREKAGRKPIEDKKFPICVYAPLSSINAIGIEEIKKMFLIVLDLKLKEIQIKKAAVKTAASDNS